MSKKYISTTFIIFFSFFSYFALAQDGGFDATFVPNLTGISTVSSIVLQPDGKILVAGTGSKGLIRINADGSQDNSFLVNTTGNSTNSVTSIGILSNGKIMVNGGLPNYNAGGLTRLNNDGSLDNSFVSGITLRDYELGTKRILIQPDDKVIISGTFVIPNNSDRIGIARIDGINPGEILESVTVNQYGNSYYYLFGYQPNGKIVYASNINRYGIGTINRLTTTTGIDGTFQSTGIWKLNTFIVEPDGKIIAGGYDMTGSFGSGNYVQYLTRLNINGDKDLSFNPPILPNLNPNGINNIKALCRLQDGKILVAYENYNENNSVVNSYLVRLNNDGSLDNTFSIKTGFDKTPQTLIQQNDGKILASGIFTSFNGTLTNQLARLQNQKITCPVINVIGGNLQNGLINTEYQSGIGSSGGMAPYAYSLVSGMLPPGIKLSNTGAFTGIPTQSGNFSFKVSATDANGCIAIQDENIKICAAISISPDSLPDGKYLEDYKVTFSASGGTAPYSYRIEYLNTYYFGGSIDAVTGIFTGVPHQSGLFALDISATDANGCITKKTFTIKVTCDIPLPLYDIPTKMVVGRFILQPVGDCGGVKYDTRGYGLASGKLPEGLTIGGYCSYLNGTPNKTGIYNFEISGSSSSGCKGLKSYVVDVVCPDMTIKPDILPPGKAFIEYNQILSTTSIDLPESKYLYGIISGQLPPGLNLDNTTGIISGKTFSPGTYSFNVKSINIYGCEVYKSYTINIPACPTLTLSPANPPAGTVGIQYNTTLIASGGTAPYRITALTGNFPPGLEYQSSGPTTGTILGVPTKAGSYDFVAVVTDTTGCTGTQNFTILINPATGGNLLPAATVNQDYTYTLPNPSGNILTLSSGSLPTGLYLDGRYGIVFGKPLVSGSFVFSVTGIVSGQPVTLNFTLNVNCPALSFLTEALPNAVLQTNYSQFLSASGGSGSYLYSLSAGALPDGLYLDGRYGNIFGKPVKNGVFTFALTATDDFGCRTGKVFTITVGCPGLSINGTPPGSNIGASYFYELSTTGNTGTALYSLATGALPTGVYLDGRYGDIFGRTTQTGTFAFTVTATDESGCQTSKDLTISVSCPALSITTTTLPDATLQTNYFQVLSATGGTGSYLYNFTGGALPDGVYLDGRYGHIFGKPVKAGTFVFGVSATDENGCTATSLITINVPALPGRQAAVAVKGAAGEAEQVVNLYPNPAAEVIMLSLVRQERVQVQMFDVMGRQVYNQAHEPGSDLKTTCDISKLASGTYFVKIIASSQTHVLKLVKN